MTITESLLEVQEFDLGADALRKQREELPQRAAQRRAQEATDALDLTIAEHEGRRSALNDRERALAETVAEAASRAAEVESQLYSGEVTAAKDLQALQQELELQRAKQRELEDGELELLEEMESADGEIAAQREKREALAARVREIGDEIREAEDEIDRQLADLAARRVGPAGQVPEATLILYDKRRAKPSLRGRGVAMLGAGNCTGCRVTLPVMEYSRIKLAPDDALECCPSCSRVLVH